MSPRIPNKPEILHKNRVRTEQTKPGPTVPERIQKKLPKKTKNPFGHFFKNQKNFQRNLKFHKKKIQGLTRAQKKSPKNTQRNYQARREQKRRIQAKKKNRISHKTVRNLRGIHGLKIRPYQNRVSSPLVPADKRGKKISQAKCQEYSKRNKSQKK